MKQGIKANTIAISNDLARINPFIINGTMYPAMICGYKAAITDELPDDLGFVMFEGTSKTNREWLSTLSDKELAELFYSAIEPAQIAFMKWLKEIHDEKEC